MMIDKKYILVIVHRRHPARGRRVLGLRQPRTFPRSTRYVHECPIRVSLFPCPHRGRDIPSCQTQWQGFITGQYETSIVEQGPIIVNSTSALDGQGTAAGYPDHGFFTSQWNALRRGQFFLDATSVLPIELGQNANYVFALPANYNGAHSPGGKRCKRSSAINRFITSNRVLNKFDFVIASPAPASPLRGRGSGATKQSALSSAKIEIASLPLVARNDIWPVFQHPVNTFGFGSAFQEFFTGHRCRFPPRSLPAGCCRECRTSTGTGSTMVFSVHCGEYICGR